MTVTTVVNWPVMWICIAVTVITGLALYRLSAPAHRADERPRSDSEQQ